MEVVTGGGSVIVELYRYVVFTTCEMFQKSFLKLAICI